MSSRSSLLTAAASVAVLLGGLVYLWSQREIRARVAAVAAPGPGQEDEQTQKPPPPNFTRVVVLFGSQSGTTEQHARLLAEELRPGPLPVKLVDMGNEQDCSDYCSCYEAGDDVPLILAMISTTGDGDFPDSTRRFVKKLKGREYCGPGVHYAVCGLGNSGYEKYNVAAVKLDRILAKSGAKRVEPPVLCDEEEGDIHAAVEAWRALWTGRICGKAICHSLEPTVPTGFKVLSGDQSESAFPPKTPGVDALAAWNGTLARFLDESVELEVIGRRVLTGTEAAPRTVELSLSALPVVWAAGDILEVLPLAPCSLAAAVMQRVLPGKLDEWKVYFERATGGRALAVVDFARQFLDLQRPTKSSCVQLLRRLGAEAETLARIEKHFSEQVAEKFYNFDEFLQEISPISPPPAGSLEETLLSFPPKTLRAYSISSSPKEKKLTLAVAVHKFGPPERPKIGQCSAWLSDEKLSTIRVRLRQNQNLPRPTSGAPAIMICNGTGIAPIRALLMDLAPANYDPQQQLPVNPDGLPQELQWRHEAGLPPKLIVIYGCRTRQNDFPYREEFERLCGSADGNKQRVISEMWVAASRAADEPRAYVQDVLFKRRAELRQLPAATGIWVCGSVAMGRAVKAALRRIRSFTGPYHEELWG